MGDDSRQQNYSAVMAEYSFSSNSLCMSRIFSTFASETNQKQKQNMRLWMPIMVVTLLLAACGEKKKSKDIITQRVVTTVSKEPVRMQPYTIDDNVAWIGRTYHWSIERNPCDSMPPVKDESGQKFIDNKFTVSVSRSDGSLFFKQVFTKSTFLSYLDADYQKTGVLEGLVFDRAEGDYLFFGVSVGHPQTDEYIPLVLRLSRMGEIQISVDTQLDTANPENSGAPAQLDDEDDGV